MFELVQAGPQSYYIDCPAKIGIYLRGGQDAYLIDSGGDKDAGRKIRRLLEQQGWTLKGIMNTHSNADHIGGNRYLQQQCGCRVFAGGIEAAFTEAPLLEPSFLYGGYPFKELRHKFLMAAASKTVPFSDEAFPREVEVIPLPGHFFEMAGFRTPDGTVYLADCLSSAEVLKKYHLSFIYDVEAYLQTLAKVEKMQAGLFVPSHAEAAEDIGPLVRLNRDKVLEIAGFLLDACAEPRGAEELLQMVFSRYGMTMTCEQYVLIGSTVRSYLSWLKDKGQLQIIIDNNRLLWAVN